jgi:hypothetical protein
VEAGMTLLNSDKIILDLCGGTGAWSRPYKEAGYDVRLIDLPNDVRLLEFNPQLHVWGILAAPPCTVFSYARQRYGLPKQGELIDALSIVDACLRAAYIYNPRWWALENPRNKLRRYLGNPKIIFKQWWFGDGQEKPTCIYGNFNMPIYNPGKRTKPSTFKTTRQNADKNDAITPPGFARAFFEANP